MTTDHAALMHDRAIRMLHSRLRWQREDIDRGEADPTDAATWHEGCFLAMERVGAITSQEAAHWRARLLEAATSPEPQPERPTAEVTTRATEHLDARFASIAATDLKSSMDLSSLISAYARTGILSAAEAGAWEERLRAKRGLPPRCSRRELLRVVPGPARRVHGLRIACVELYDDGVALRWHSARDGHGGDEVARVWNDVSIEMAGYDYPDPSKLSDDLGTRYVGGGGPHTGIDSGSVVRFGTAVFAPAVPDAAASLHVPVRDAVIDIDLRHG